LPGASGIDPGLALAIAFWLGTRSGWLLVRRVRFGREAWPLEDLGGASLLNS